MKIFTAVEIGCLECGNEHTVIGSFLDKDKAQSAAEEYNKEVRNGEYGWNSYQINIFESELVE